jgi:hypothetical protein
MMELDRRKIFVIGGAFIILLLIIINVLLRSKISIYKNLYNRALNDLDTIKILAREAEELGGFSQEGVLPPNLSLFSYVEEVARNSDIVLDSINPLSSEEKGSVRTISISVSAKEIPPDSLMRFLYGLEYDSQYGLKIERLHIKTSFKDRTKVDLKMDISALQKK